MPPKVSLYKAEPRDGHAICTLRMHPSTSPCPALCVEAEPISLGHCQKWHYKMKDSCCLQTDSLVKEITNLHTHWTTSKDCTIWFISSKLRRKNGSSFSLHVAIETRLGHHHPNLRGHPQLRSHWDTLLWLSKSLPNLLPNWEQVFRHCLRLADLELRM